MNRSLAALGLVVVLLFASSQRAAGATPQMINYQGRLATSQENPQFIDATLEMEFRIFGSLSGSDLLWSESWSGVSVTDGVFNVLLGSQGQPIPASIFSESGSHYLEMVIAGETLSPRQQFSSVAFALVADTVDGAEAAELEESAEIDLDIATHDSDASAHSGPFSTHTHDDRYYTEGEIDSTVRTGPWSIVGDGAEGNLEIVHPDGGAQPVAMMTLTPPASGGMVGIGTSDPVAALDVDGSLRIGTGAGAAEGTLRFTGADFEGRAQGEWVALGINPPEQFADVTDFGALGDGVTDDSAAIQSAIDSLSARGGVVFFPAGHFVVNSQITFPNWLDEFGRLRQRPYKLVGIGPYLETRNYFASSADGGSVIDLRYSAGPKIATYGTALLEIEGITLADFGTDAIGSPFIYTTNTTLHIHDMSFFGKLAGTWTNDAIVLGGTSTANPGGDGINDPFQGYGTVIRDVYFQRIRRAVYGRAFCNGVVFVNNFIWSNCGSDLPNGAAIEIDGNPDGIAEQSASGWYVAGNSIEVPGYEYGIKAAHAQRHTFVGNSFWDPGDVTKAYYRFEESAQLNLVIAGFHEDHLPFVEDHAQTNSRSTVIDSHQNRESVYPQKVRFLNSVYLESEHPVLKGPRLVNGSADELAQVFRMGNSLAIELTPSGSSGRDLWEVRDAGDGIIVQELKGTDARLRSVAGSVRLQAAPGSFVEVGNTSGEGLRVQDGALQFQGTSAMILSGVGAPGAPAPDGSLYLRSDGAAGSTLYVRENGTWVAK